MKGYIKDKRINKGYIKDNWINESMIGRMYKWMNEWKYICFYKYLFTGLIVPHSLILTYTPSYRDR